MAIISIAEETHKELTKIKGELMAKTGKPDVTYNEVIIELIKRFKELKK